LQALSDLTKVFGQQVLMPDAIVQDFEKHLISKIIKSDISQ
jgi:hypothetical protein